VSGGVWRAAGSISAAECSAEHGRFRGSCCDFFVAGNRASADSNNLEETMTTFNSSDDRDRGHRVIDQFNGVLPARRIFFWALVAGGALIAIWLVSSFLVDAKRIEAGYVGIEVNLAGSQRGPSEIPVRTGGCFIAR
jgi:hypothetical protein